MDTEAWLFTLSPADVIVPRYRADVPDNNQPRAAKAYRREVKKSRQSAYKSFLLPRGTDPSVDAAESSTYSDSEDDTPQREALVHVRWVTPAETPSPPPDKDQKLSLSYQLSRHRELEKTHPDIVPLSCVHCRKVAVDLRRQHAYKIVPAEEERPKGWHVQPSRTGFTYGEAMAAAADGCSFLSFVVGNLQGRGSNGVISHDSEVTITGVVQSMASVGFSIQLAYQGKLQHRQAFMQSLDLYTVPGTKPLHEAIGHFLPPNLVPNSELSFARARSWLNTCDGNHDCRVHAINTPYMPRRVIEIDKTLSTLRLRLATDAPTAPYAALSYCWGGDQMAKTVKSKLGEYERDIDPRTLPQTIQDAITVTGGIGLRYLWVDAMCIVQDDDQDKAEQIGQMYAVYRSAYVTISAATASSSQEGFLQPRTSFRGFTLAARLDDNVFGSVLAMPEPRFLPRSAHPVDYPLFTRGWTYQEHQLSPRVLIYGSREIIYWCAESSHRDGGNEHFHWQEHNHYASLLFYQAQLETLVSSNKPPNLQKSWSDVVENYSQRKLTVENDKLPAVAAVAEQYANSMSVSGEDYLAGLWREDLLSQCLWRVWDPKKTRRPVAYRAPSWSWAALDGAIYPYVHVPQHENDMEERRVSCCTCVLIQAETTLSSENMPFGNVQTGMMRIRTKMRRVIWLNQDEYRDGKYQALGPSCGRDPDMSDEELALLGHLDGADPRLTINIDVVGEWAASSEVGLWSAEIHAVSRCGGDENEVESAEGLLLEPVAGTDTFKRVGTISVQTREYMREPYWFSDQSTEWREITIL